MKKTGLMIMMMMTVIIQLPTETEATCNSCNDRLKVSLICCIFDGRCCVLGPVAVGKRDLSWVQERYKERQEEDLKLELQELEREKGAVVHPLARPRD